jgi:toxin ParE1/3/4
VRIEVSSFVESDLDAIADYIAQDNPRRALSFIQEVREQILELEHRALRIRIRHQLGEEARIAWVGRYGILFRIHNDAVKVERVVYGTHELLALLQQDE